MNWKSGDIAVCVNASHIGHDQSKGNYYPPLKLNAEYIVQNIYECIKCKRLSFDVGLTARNPKGIICVCNSPLLNNGTHWCQSERFVKKDLRTQEEQISEAIEKEDYELAEQLKNQ